MHCSVNLIGNLGQHPEIRVLKSGDRVAKLSVATSNRWKDKKTGAPSEKTQWHTIIIYDPQTIDVCENYLQKGSKVHIQGTIDYRKWNDKVTGKQRTKAEIVLSFGFGLLNMLDRPSAEQSIDGPGPDYDIPPTHDEIPH